MCGCRIRRDIIASIGKLLNQSMCTVQLRWLIKLLDDPYSLEQLKAPRMNISVVRPLVDSLYEIQDLSISKSTAPEYSSFI